MQFGMQKLMNMQKSSQLFSTFFDPKMESLMGFKRESDREEQSCLFVDGLVVPTKWRPRFDVLVPKTRVVPVAMLSLPRQHWPKTC